MTTAPFAVSLILVLIAYGSFFLFCLFMPVILPDQGGKGSTAADGANDKLTGKVFWS